MPVVRRLLAAAGLLGAGGAVLVGRVLPEVGWALVAFGTIWAMVSLRALGEERERLVIDDAGIRDTMLPVGTIGWDEVRGAFVRQIGRTSVVVLDLRDPERFLRRLPAVRRFIAGKALQAGLPGIYLTLAGTDASAEEVAEMIRRRIGPRST